MNNQPHQSHGRKTVVLFGDSLLGRVGKDLAEKLEEVTNTSVYNCAMGGISSRHGAEKAPFIGKLDPDYVVLSFGGNDAAPWKEYVDANQFRENMATIIKNFDQSKIIIFLMPPVGELDLPGQTEEYNNNFEQYRQATESLYEQSGCSVIDSPKIYGELAKSGTSYHLNDNVHINEIAYEILIQELSRYIS